MQYDVFGGLNVLEVNVCSHNGQQKMLEYFIAWSSLSYVLMDKHLTSRCERRVMC